LNLFPKKIKIRAFWGVFESKSFLVFFKIKIRAFLPAIESVFQKIKNKDVLGGG